MISFEHFTVALGTIIPLFSLIMIGVFVGRMHWFTEKELGHINHMVFRLFFFVTMFYSLYNSNPGDALHPRLLVFAFIALLSAYAVVFLLILFTEKDPRRKGTMIHCSSRSNFLLMAIPIATSLSVTGNIDITVMMMAVFVPVYNILGVTAMEIFRGGKLRLVDLLLRICKNPMILGAFFGFLFLQLGIRIPQPIMKPLSQISAATTPLALIILGASFKWNRITGGLKQLITVISLKLILIPGIVFFAAIQMGSRGEEFIALIPVFATLCAVATFVMAEEMNGDPELAGNCVVYSSALSCFTIFGWIIILKSLGIF